MSREVGGIALLVMLAMLGAAGAAEPGDSGRGAQAFRACIACHSLQPERHMTGPSLAGIWGQRAGSIAGFERYSPALKSADVVWDAATLDPWLAAPQRFIPGNWMTFQGMKDPQARADLIAYLKNASSSSSAARREPQPPDLRRADPSRRVVSIAHCRDTYRVTTADGETRAFWERNLRFKTDSTERGPARDAPAIADAGMMGDRASVIFAEPDEISRFIRGDCKEKTQ